MFEFTKARLDRARADFVGFYRHHVWGFVLPLAATAIALPSVRVLAGADVREETWLLLAYGVFGPLALALLIFVWFYVRAGGLIYREQMKGIRDEAAPTYWTLCEVVTWLAYGKAMGTQNYSLDGTSILAAEERPAVHVAERTLLTALQNPDRIVAYGMKDRRAEHAAVPFTYFLNPSVGINIFNDSFQLGRNAKIEDFLQKVVDEWTEVRILKSQVIGLWPKGRLYARPSAVNAVSAAVAIQEFLQTADSLMATKLSGPEGVQALEEEYVRWRGNVVGWLFANSSEDRADHFARGGYLIINRHDNEVDETHRYLLSKIAHDRSALADILVLETST